MSSRERRGHVATPEHVFPPDVVRTLRAHVTSKGGCLADTSDDLLVDLLSTIFWAGLETPYGMVSRSGPVTTVAAGRKPPVEPPWRSCEYPFIDR